MQIDADARARPGHAAHDPRGLRRRRLHEAARPLQAGVDLLVGTPGRLHRLPSSARVDLHASRCSSSTRPTGCSTWGSSATCAASCAAAALRAPPVDALLGDPHRSGVHGARLRVHERRREGRDHARAGDGGARRAAPLPRRASREVRALLWAFSTPERGRPRAWSSPTRGRAAPRGRAARANGYSAAALTGDVDQRRRLQDRCRTSRTAAARSSSRPTSRRAGSTSTASRTSSTTTSRRTPRTTSTGSGARPGPARRARRSAWSTRRARSRSKAWSGSSASASAWSGPTTRSSWRRSSRRPRSVAARPRPVRRGGPDSAAADRARPVRRAGRPAVPSTGPGAPARRRLRREPPFRRRVLPMPPRARAGAAAGPGVGTRRAPPRPRPAPHGPLGGQNFHSTSAWASCPPKPPFRGASIPYP